MTLKTQMAADIDDVFLNTDDFGEAATLLPLGDASQGISLTVVVSALKLDIDPQQAEEIAEREIKVSCKKSALTGVDLDQDNLGHALLIDSEPELRWDFIRIDDDANGMLDLVFRRSVLQTLRPAKLNAGR